MKTRNELIEYFMESLEYDDMNIIVDELKEEYKENHFRYSLAEGVLRILVSFEEFDAYDTTTTDFMTILLCNTFVLGYEQCKKDIIKDIKGTTKKR